MVNLGGSVPLITALQWIGYALIVGVVLPIGFIAYKRRHYRGKVLCIMYLKTREIVHKFLQPNDRDLLEWGDGYYIYNEDWIALSRHWLAGKVPTLTYIENNPLPTNLRGYTRDELEITAKQLSSDFQDNAFKSFAEATDTNIKETVTQQIRKDFMLMFIAMAAFIGVIGFAIWSKLGSLSG